MWVLSKRSLINEKTIFREALVSLVLLVVNWVGGRKMLCL
jgi:hypothetical protein